MPAFRTVVVVMYVLIGLLAGVAAGLGLLPLLGPAISSGSDAVVALVLSLGSKLLASIDPVDGVDVAAGACAVLALLAPAVAAAALAAVARTSVKARRVASSLLALAGLAGFFLLPLPQALLLAGVCATAASLVGLLSGLLLTVPCAALSAALIVATIRTRIVDPTPSAVQAAQAASDAFGLTSQLWLLLSAALAVPFLLAAGRSLLKR